MAKDDELNRLRSVGLSSKVKEQPTHLSSLPRASVLVLLFEKDAELHTLLTKRAKTLSSHPGDVCFCGGRQDPDDESDDIATALREAREEVGLATDNVIVISRLRAVESKNRLCVTPIIGWIDQFSLDDLTVSKSEVDAAFSVPLSYFIREENCSSKHDITWAGERFTMRTYFYRDEGRTFKIWGLTAAIAHEVARIATGGGGGWVATDELVAGYLFRRELVGDGIAPKPVWRRYFYSLAGPGRVLHQHENEMEASRKALSASKKNRLPLSDCVVSARLIDDEAGRFQFVLDALDGRLSWTLAAESSEERDRWIRAIRCSSQPTEDLECREERQSDRIE